MGGVSAGSGISVSGSEYAQRRRRALREAGTSIMLVDSAGVVQMATGARGLVGAMLADVLNAPPRAVADALAAARGGTESAVPDATELSARCLPMRAEAGRDAFVLVEISDGRSEPPEVEELRERAGELEALAEATGALARSLEPEDAKRTVCETALDVTKADFAALLELDEGDDAIVVSTSSDAALEGARAPLERATMAARALGAGDLAFAAEIGEDLAAWPLEGAGVAAAAWQPIRRAGGIREVVAVGWRNAPPPGVERLGETMGRHAAEAAVALDRSDAVAQLSGMARTDPLTELSNRRAWEEELAREMAVAQRGG